MCLYSPFPVNEHAILFIFPCKNYYLTRIVTNITLYNHLWRYGNSSTPPQKKAINLGQKKWHTPVAVALEKQRQGNCELKASLSYRVKLCPSCLKLNIQKLHECDTETVHVLPILPNLKSSSLEFPNCAPRNLVSLPQRWHFTPYSIMVVLGVRTDVLESHTPKHNLWVLDKIAVANFTFMIQNHLTFSKRHILCFRKTGFYSTQIQASSLTMNSKEHWDGSGGRKRECTSSHPIRPHVPSQLLQTHFIINL